MKRLLFIPLMLVLFVFSCAPAHSADGAVSHIEQLSAGSMPLSQAELLAAHVVPAPAPAVTLGGFLQQSIFPVITALFMGFVTLFLSWVGNKYKIDALTKKGNYLEKIALQGITLAEERAAQLVNTNYPLTSSSKLDVAVKHVLAVMPSVSAEQADAVVHALLAQIPGLGATKEKAYSTSGMLAVGIESQLAV